MVFSCRESDAQMLLQDVYQKDNVSLHVLLLQASGTGAASLQLFVPT